MNKPKEFTIKETWDYINKTKKSLADKWMKNNEAIFKERAEAENEYRRIIEERAINETAKSNLLETYKNNLLGKALKAVYITALEAETLTDKGIILAEDLVNKYIDEQGGATKLMNRNSGKTYFLDMIFNKVNEAANRQLEEFISGKSEAAEVEEDEEEEVTTESVSYLNKSRSFGSLFEKALLEEEGESEDSDEEKGEDKSEDSSEDNTDDTSSDTDTGDSADEEESDKEETNDDGEDSEESNSEEETEEGSDDEESEEEEDDGLSPELDDEVIDSEKDDPLGGDTDSEDSSEEDDEVVVDDDEDGVDDNDDASEEKDLRDDLSSDEQEDADPAEKTDDEFLKDLDQEEDVQKAVDLIRARVANAEEEFIKRNAEDKKKINDLLGKISDNVKVVKDISVNDSDKSAGDEVVDTDGSTESEEDVSTEEAVKIQIAKERVGACKRMIHDIRENKNFTIYEKFVRNLSNSIMKDKSVMESYLIEGEMDFASIMESCKIMYAWLETVNTLQLEKVNPEYIKNILDGIK